MDTAVIDDPARRMRRETAAGGGERRQLDKGSPDRNHHDRAPDPACASQARFREALLERRLAVV